MRTIVSTRVQVALSEDEGFVVTNREDNDFKVRTMVYEAGDDHVHARGYGISKVDRRSLSIDRTGDVKLKDVPQSILVNMLRILNTRQDGEWAL